MGRVKVGIEGAEVHFGMHDDRAGWLLYLQSHFNIPMSSITWSINRSIACSSIICHPSINQSLRGLSRAHAARASVRTQEGDAGHHQM